MASINDLRTNGGRNINNPNTTVIDTSRPETIEMSANGINRKVVRPKTIVNSKSVDENRHQRVEMDMSSLPEDNSMPPTVTPIDDILEGPDSKLAKYMAARQKRMDDEEALDENDEEIENGTIADNTELNNFASVDDEEFAIEDDQNENFVAVDDDDLFNKEDDTTEKIMNDFYDEDEEDIAEDNNIVEEDTEIIKSVDDIPETEYDKEDLVDIEMNSTTADIGAVDDDEEDEKSSDGAEPVSEENSVLKHLQKIATEKIKPVSKKLDISSFTVAKKPTANVKFLNQQQVKVAKWVLPNQETTIQMKEYLGQELEDLREFSENRTSISSLTRKYRSIYDHIVSPKPGTYEAWCKSTPVTDLDHYFFGVYIAAFKGSNYIPMYCKNDKCKETYLTDDLPIMELVKFGSDEDKAKFTKIYQSEDNKMTSSGLYVTEIVPLSNSIAISFKEASLYSALEVASLDSAFKDKHENIINFIPYIDALYIIDQQNSQLIPIGYKLYPDNATKSAKSKILKYESVLKSLSPDEFNMIRSYINSIGTRSGIKMSYQYPESTCPKCNSLTPAVSVTAEEMVFTRYQLGALVTTAIR